MSRVLCHSCLKIIKKIYIYLVVMTNLPVQPGTRHFGKLFIPYVSIIKYDRDIGQ
jgi:hypothetical protein